MQLLRTLEGHDNIVWSVAFSPNSKWVASGSAGIKVWEVESGRQIFHFDGHKALVVSVAFHPHLPWLASASYDGTVRAWDLTSGRPLGILHRFDQSVHGVAFSPDGNTLAAACHDKRVAIWKSAELSFSDDAKKPPEAGIFPPSTYLEGHTTPCRAVCFSPDGRVLATGADQGTIILWDANSWTRTVTLPSGTGQIRSLSFSSDGQFLAGAAYVSPTVVWDLAALRRTLGEMNLDW
jgi:WD40 repeat protein